MLLKPDQAVFETMRAEIFDFEHPEHYETYMPEQEYLSRFYGTFDNWTHISCQYNFEIDKNERIPHDFSGAHENIRNGAGHRGAVVLHYSGASSPDKTVDSSQISVIDGCRAVTGYCSLMKHASCLSKQEVYLKELPRYLYQTLGSPL